MLSDKESFSGDRFIYFWIFFDKLLEFFHHIFPFFFCHLWIIIAKYNIDPCDRCSTCKGSSPCRRRMDKWIWIHHTLPYLFCRYKCTHWHHSSSECLSYGHDIRSYSPVRYSPEFPCTTKSSLHFISNKQSSMLLRKLSYSWPVIIRWNHCSGFSLYWLDNNSCNPDSELFTCLKLFLHSFSISILHEVYLTSIHLTNWLTIYSLPHHRK